MRDGRPLSPKLVEFFESGVSVLVATRDAQLRPVCARAMGASVRRDGRVVTIFIPNPVASRTVENVRDNGAIAVTFVRPLTHEGVQIKGTCTSIRESDEDARELQERYRAAYAEQLRAVGIPRQVTSRLVCWPSVAIDLEVRDVFVQTPGPGAGRRLESDA